MKIKTLLRGSDGVREYEAGEVLEGDSQHVRTLLMNDLAEPLDDHAKSIHDAMLAMTEDEWAGHPLHSDAHWDRGEEERAALAEQAEQGSDEADVVVQRSGAPQPLPQEQIEK